jgi:protease IV
MKRRTAWILVAGVAAVAIGAAAVGGLALALRGRGTGWSANNYLYLDLQGEISEEPPGSDLGTIFERQPPSLRTLVESLERAADDPRVSAVVLRVSVLPEAGWATAQELRDAVGRFRRSGKPAYAHLEFCGNKEYYLASGCDKIFALPSAIIELTGLRSEVSFFKGTLEKVGIQAQFEGVGKYKNAPNQFTESGFTAPHREQMEALLDSLYGQYVAAIAQGRRRTPEEVRAIVDAGPYDGASALKAGLVDELIYQDQLDTRLKGASRLTPGRYVKGARGLGFDGRPKIALVYVVGDIIPGRSQNSPLGGGFAGSDTVAEAIKEAREDDSLRAILLRVDSPGGSGTASEVIWREVALARQKKPVVVSMGDVAASGGYYVAMGSDAIVAEPGTITGSIGVFGGKFSLRGLYDKVGISKEILMRGQHADVFSAYRPWDDEERARIRELMESFYKDFVTKVARGRHKSYEDVDAIAQGRVWTGAEAQHRGLVDRLGGFDVALEIAKDKARIGKRDEVRLVVLPERKSLLEQLLERQDDGVQTALPADVRSLLRWAVMLGDGRPLARLPFDLRVF